MLDINHAALFMYRFSMYRWNQGSRGGATGHVLAMKKLVFRFLLTSCVLGESSVTFFYRRLLDRSICGFRFKSG